MELLSKDITLGFYNDTGTISLPLPQYDVERLISVGFTNNGKRFEIPENTSVFLKAVKPDGKQINTDEWCSIQDNKAIIEVSKQLTAVPGTVKCELVLSDDTGKQYTSNRFNIVVSKSVHNDENLLSTDTYKNIIDILLELDALKKDLVFKKEKDQPGGVPSLDENVKIPRHELYDADLNSKGTVKLVDSVESSSTSDAATPNSVKTVNDTLAEHMTDTENPHHLTKEQLGLAFVDNTSDADKPVSTAQKAVNDLIGVGRDSATQSTNISYSYPDLEQDKCLNANGISTLVQAVHDLSKRLSEAVLKVKRSIPTIKRNNTVLIPDATNSVNITVPTKVSELQNDCNFKTTDTNTWKANTKDSEGYIPAGKGHANQVWRTDADGNPGWRENSVGAALGFTPVQQGGGVGQGANKVKIGWSTTATGLKATVDSTDLGKVYTQNNCDIVIPVNRGGTGATTAANACANIGAVKKAGDTMTGALNFANNKWNLMGDDAFIGDANVSGALCIKGNNGNTKLAFFEKGSTTKKRFIEYASDGFKTDTGIKISQPASGAYSGTYAVMERTDTGKSISVGIGSSGTNRGIFDNPSNQWMIYKDAGNKTRIPGFAYSDLINKPLISHFIWHTDAAEKLIEIFDIGRPNAGFGYLVIGEGGPVSSGNADHGSIRMLLPWKGTRDEGSALSSAYNFQSIALGSSGSTARWSAAFVNDGSGNISYKVTKNANCFIRMTIYRVAVGQYYV
ncbi:MAG: phage tail protein [Lachnospiraceae bacterium]|nr:phage tail protein [Lachnospiraceae bacterium]